jgi:transposase InsO family protein
MPWQEVDIMSLRYEFVKLAMDPDANIRGLCRQFKISPTTGYKWLRRYQQLGLSGLADRSRRPRSSPNKTSPEMEKRVLSVRDSNSKWAGRKIKRCMENSGVSGVPAASTINAILRRHGRIEPEESQKHRPWQRFEADAPNDLWQMDFKGHFAMENFKRCYPLTILDDHSRFCIGLYACKNECRSAVQAHLTTVFRNYGIPDCILTDNGPPWGTWPSGRLTKLGVWMVQLGITLLHSRPRHPQTLGKDERFHRTLKSELLSWQLIKDLDHAQQCFDPWRETYNHVRPHDALDLDTPGSHYQSSSRMFPEVPVPVEYDQGLLLRKVGVSGQISFKNRIFRVGKALAGFYVALEKTGENEWQVYFSHQKIRKIKVNVEVEV